MLSSPQDEPRSRGGFGPQPHPNFIGVLCEATLNYRHGEVARAGEDTAEVGRCCGCPVVQS
jgi:hypothetical protein